ncbi:MAG: hypothetical protein R3F17_04405, partial [Planctomycetota bacterium]
MHGSMCAHAGVLYVGRHAKSAQITAYDLDGRLLRRIAEYRDEHAGRSSAAGLSLDADHRLWVADQAAGVLRGFTLFGVQVAEIRQEQGGADVAGELGEPVAVLALGSDDELVLTVASAGRRRHAVQVLEPAGGRSLSLRPDGDPEGRFEDVLGLASRGSRDLLVLEGSPRRVQVFRGGNFHFSIALDEIPGHGPAT